MWKDSKQQNEMEKKDPFKADLPVLTPEQTIMWLTGMRDLMLEVWSKNPNQIPEILIEKSTRPSNFSSQTTDSD